MTTSNEVVTDVPAAMKQLYSALERQGFVNRTPPTPDEWDHPSGYQVRISHVARTTNIRHRSAPPEPPGKIYSVEGQRQYDRMFGWSELSWTQNCPPAEFARFLANADRAIGISLRMHAAQSQQV